MDKYFDFSGILLFDGIFNSDAIYLKVNFDIIFRDNNVVAPVRQTLRLNIDGFKTSIEDSKVMGVPFDVLSMVKLLIYPYFIERNDSLSFGYVNPTIEIVEENDNPFIEIYTKIEKVIITEIFPLQRLN